METVARTVDVARKEGEALLLPAPPSPAVALAAAPVPEAQALPLPVGTALLTETATLKEGKMEELAATLLQAVTLLHTVEVALVVGDAVSEAERLGTPEEQPDTDALPHTVDAKEAVGQAIDEEGVAEKQAVLVGAIAVLLTVGKGEGQAAAVWLCLPLMLPKPLPPPPEGLPLAVAVLLVDAQGLGEGESFVERDGRSVAVAEAQRDNRGLVLS